MIKHKLNPTLLNQIDLVLFEEGNFTPLNWMLRYGHLDVLAYSKWKEGKIEYLEDTFTTPRDNIITILENIKEYLSIQKLEPDQYSYTSQASQALHICRSPTNERIFTTIYQPTQDRVQMDLFFDNTQAITVSNLIAAIVDRQTNETEDLMEKLEYLDLEKHKKLSQLLTYEKEIMHGKITSEEKIKLIKVLSSLAYEHLHRYTHDFITPLWHRVSNDISDIAFDSKTPDFHISFTAYQGFQWQGVIESIKREKNWTQYPILIFRYAEACFKLNREKDGIAYWFKLFVLFPQQAEHFVKKSSHQKIIFDWQCFTELDPELEPSSFPAWILMKTPALAKNTLVFEENTCQTLALINSLVCNAENKLNVDLRAKLQQTNPNFFVHYMRNINGYK
ncbi:MAG: general stress protein [Methylococcaceae bacterium]|nr:general stress protein [Methylococcaceae bacterium]